MDTCKQKKKVLALGYLPKWRGGLQKTGLATGIFDLHNAVNAVSQDVEVVIVATDIFEKEIQVDNTRVIGWTRTRLLKHALRYFYRVPYFFSHLIALVKYYPIINPIRDLFKVLLLDYAIEKEKPDFIHLHGVLYALFRPFIWDKNIPVILRIHGLNGQNTTYKHYQKFCRMEKEATRIDFDIVTFLTEENRRQWKEYYGEFSCPMFVFFNGYDSAIFHAPDTALQKKYNLITIGGISENKGQLLVLQSLTILKQKGVSLKYLIVGDGEDGYVRQLKQYVGDNALEVTFMNYCPQTTLPKLLWQSDYFILESLTEGFGKVIIESLASGTPVILPSHLPIVKQKSIINDNNTILTNRDSKSIASVLLSLYDKGFSSIDVSHTVAEYAWTSIAKQYSQIYQ